MAVADIMQRFSLHVPNKSPESSDSFGAVWARFPEPLGGGPYRVFIRSGLPECTSRAVMLQSAFTDEAPLRLKVRVWLVDAELIGINPSDE